MLVGLACVVAGSISAADFSLHQFKRSHLEKYYWSEGAAFGDLNQDGKQDVISGPYWWEGPDFNKRHEIYPATRTTKTKKDGKDVEFPGFEGDFGSKNSYSIDNFFAFVHDLNGDGWNDVLTYGLPNTPAYLYLNPKGKEKHWTRHTVLDHVDNESPTFTDITGDGKPEIVCNYLGDFGYASPDWSDPTAKWKFTPITKNGKWARFTHGLGVGDLNGDRRLDLMFKDGWFAQPESLKGNPVWKYHAVKFAPTSAQMYAYDVNGDGRADVVTALASHGYGLAWHEQLAEKDDAGSPKWRSHVFMHKKPEENRYGVAFPELHAVELFDVDGDGLKDIITGNCYWAHGPAVAPGPGEEGVLYWFKLVRNADKSVDWVPHLIDGHSGVGRQIGTGDVNGDGRTDLVIGNKLGTFVFTHETKKVSSEAYAAAQPKAKFPAFKDQRLDKMAVIVHTKRPSGRPAVVQPPGRSGKASSSAKPAVAKGGVLPKGKDGKALNLDFESGTLKDWTAKGDAFAKQPAKGPISQTRIYGEGKIALREGDYWLGGYEIQLSDKGKGTLTSAPFKVTHPYAAFRIGGGSHAGTRVELSLVGAEKPFFTARGSNSETMQPVEVDLRAHSGKEIFIRLVDEVSGGWGHVNFDDFKFYPAKPKFSGALVAVARRKVNPADAALPVDKVANAGLSPQKAAEAMAMPKGFKAHVFAAEPDVKQPIALCLDDRGRLWIAEAYGYPLRQPEGEGKDRILVFEDSNGDGKFDRRTVFIEGLNLVSGIEYGFGGIYVGAAPYLYFIPIADGDAPKPAGKPQVLLEGWAYQDTHEMLNSFQWGPDGWLYGCHGVFTHSHVKQPQDPESKRQYINAGVWRYHPVRHEFEVFAEGTSNPWGIDFNEYGHAFIEACVIPHFWHIFQGGKFQRQAGQHFLASHDEISRIDPGYFKQDFAKGPKPPLHPYVYDDIKSHGDHLHYLGSRPHAGNNRSDAVGGGHAHSGLLIYQGDSWPAEYRGKVFMNNIHGQRINMDLPVREGSGYVGKHGADLINFNDSWSQILNFRTDRDGSVYLIDWYDGQACHRREPEVHDRSNGRIFKIVYNDQPAKAGESDPTRDVPLAIALLSRNESQVRHAQRQLQERAAVGKLDPWAGKFIRHFAGLDAAPQYTWLAPKRSRELGSETVRLRAIWAGHVTGTIDSKDLQKLLADRSENIRAWAVQLLCERGTPPDAALKEFARLAAADKSALVRLYLASALQRIDVNQRLPILEGLLSRESDKDDHNLPLMYWYAAEPVVGANRLNAVKLLTKTKIPVIRQFITRRMTAGQSSASGGGQ